MSSEWPQRIETPARIRHASHTHEVVLMPRRASPQGNEKGGSSYYLASCRWSVGQEVGKVR